MNMEFFTLFLVCREEYVNLPWSSVVLKTDICPSATAGQGPCKQPSELMIRQRINVTIGKSFYLANGQSTKPLKYRASKYIILFF